MDIKTLNSLRDMIAELRREAPELPIQQLQVFILVAMNEGVTGSTLLKLTGMTQASMTRNVNALLKYAGQGREGLEWLEWRTDPNDLRARPLYLTAKGRDILERVTKHITV